jgi:hypothetical protein
MYGVHRATHKYLSKSGYMISNQNDAKNELVLVKQPHASLKSIQLGTWRCHLTQNHTLFGYKSSPTLTDLKSSAASTVRVGPGGP